MRLITFTDLNGFGIFPPKKNTELIPSWYKKTNSYINKVKEVIDPNGTTATIKKCIPVFDAMAAGYTLFTQTDIVVKQQEDGPYYFWPSGGGIEFHAVIQAPLHPMKNENPYPKIINPYGIKTPRSYSALFLPPLHNPNGIFTAMPGIVDTDKYSQAINFPFTLNDSNWEGTIPAGTPIVQVIPFKRESWVSKIGGKREINEHKEDVKLLNTKFFDKYKTLFWEKKVYN